MAHSTPENEDLNFVDISIERYRVYTTPNGEYRIENPVALAVKPSGSHRVLAEHPDEENLYVSHYIPADGRRPIRWVVEENKPFFIGWGEKAVKNTGIHTQPSENISESAEGDRGFSLPDTAEKVKR
jgi:hypothetical protein